jgi:hypothetical protein
MLSRYRGLPLHNLQPSDFRLRWEFFFKWRRAPQQTLRTHRSLEASCATVWWRWRWWLLLFIVLFLVMEHRWNEIDRGKSKYSEKNPSQCHLCWEVWRPHTHSAEDSTEILWRPHTHAAEDSTEILQYIYWQIATDVSKNCNVFFFTVKQSKKKKEECIIVAGNVGNNSQTPT